MTKLTNTTGTSASLALQPITVSWLQAARDAGGDAIDLDPANGPFICMMRPCNLQSTQRMLANPLCSSIDNIAVVL
jgi:hypothetical protein